MIWVTVLGEIFEGDLGRRFGEEGDFGGGFSLTLCSKNVLT